MAQIQKKSMPQRTLEMAISEPNCQIILLIIGRAVEIFGDIGRQ